MRTSLLFSITFEDSDTTLVPYSADLADSEPFKVYCSSRSELNILLMTRADARLYISNINRTEIQGYQIGDTAYLSLRYFDGVDREWYDSLGLPDPSRTFYVDVTVSKINVGRRPSVVLRSSTPSTSSLPTMLRFTFVAFSILFLCRFWTIVFGSRIHRSSTNFHDLCSRCSIFFLRLPQCHPQEFHCLLVRT